MSSALPRKGTQLAMRGGFGIPLSSSEGRTERKIRRKTSKERRRVGRRKTETSSDGISLVLILSGRALTAING